MYIGGVLILIGLFIAWFVLVFLCFVARLPPVIKFIVFISYPVFIAGNVVYSKYIEKYVMEIKAERSKKYLADRKNRLIQYCDKHVKDSTHIMRTLDVKPPISIYFEYPNSALYSNYSYDLRVCVELKKTAACEKSGLQFIEWAEFSRNPGSDFCRNAPSNYSGGCTGKINRISIGKKEIANTVDSPISEYYFRQILVSGGLEDPYVFLLELRSLKNNDVLATTKILDDISVGYRCPSPEQEILSIVQQVFKGS